MPRDEYVVDFPTLYVVAAWIRRHCRVADGFQKDEPFELYDWQLWCTLNHYRVRGDAKQNPGYLQGVRGAIPIRSEAFVYRRSQIMAPQKTGKGPWSATIVIAEAVGPVLFLDWAKKGDVYRCSDYGCGCGWVYRYLPGEAKGHPWPTPIVQLLATSEDQVDNVYKHVKVMARAPRLKDKLKVREGFLRVINEDTDPDSSRVDVVTASANSRLGNPVTFCLQDETQLYTETNGMVKTAQTMRRGAAPMGGRSMETTNPYDPAENSIAQRTHTSNRPDIFKFYEPPPEDLDYGKKRDRAKIHRYNYAGSPHANLPGIEAEAAELMETDPGQAERFYGNRIVAGLGQWMPITAGKGRANGWSTRKAEGKTPEQRIRRLAPAGTAVTGGFDGSDKDDWTGFRLQTKEGFQFTPTFADGRPMIWNPADYGGQVPRLEVDAAMDHILSTWRLVRMYLDPPHWETDIDRWAEKYGDDVVIKWETYRPRPMTTAADRLLTDVTKRNATFTHDDCPVTLQHMGAAKKSSRPNGTYALVKPGDGRKIDMAIPSVLAHEAAGDVTNADEWPKPRRQQTVHIF